MSEGISERTRELEIRLAREAALLGASKRGLLRNKDGRIVAYYFFTRENEEVLRFNTVIKKQDRKYTGQKGRGIIWKDEEMAQISEFTGLLGN